MYRVRWITSFCSIQFCLALLGSLFFHGALLGALGLLSNTKVTDSIKQKSLSVSLVEGSAIERKETVSKNLTIPVTNTKQTKSLALVAVKHNNPKTQVMPERHAVDLVSRQELVSEVGSVGSEKNILHSDVNATGASMQEQKLEFTQAGFLQLHIADWLAQHKRYPRAALRARIEGVAQVRFLLVPDGRILESKIERSSGASILDEAAISLLLRASPIPNLKQFALTQAIELHIPIHYSIDRS